MKNQLKAVNEITRRNFMKKSSLTVGAIMFLSQGTALAQSSGSGSGSGRGNCNHDWAEDGTESMTINGVRWCSPKLKCKKPGCLSTRVVGPWTRC
ncbi:MAG: twin-arginine translocation signal domain-containing protein [Verrucomicrobia bacterium]|nr:MAG: twin-arginine translocation signal domain-containing protein [Verrucomicrobiota bacterium]